MLKNSISIKSYGKEKKWKILIFEETQLGTTMTELRH